MQPAAGCFCSTRVADAAPGTACVTCCACGCPSSADFAALSNTTGLFLEVSTCAAKTVTTFDTQLYVQSSNPYQTGFSSAALLFDDNCLPADGGGSAFRSTASRGRVQLLSPNDAPYVVVEGRVQKGGRLGLFQFAWRVVTLTLPANATVVERRPSQ